jgi:hypothetical protein
MKVLAIIEVVSDARMEEVRAELANELRGSWALFASGVLREAYDPDSDTRRLRAENVAQAEKHLRKLPLVAAGHLTPAADRAPALRELVDAVRPMMVHSAGKWKPEVAPRRTGWASAIRGSKRCPHPKRDCSVSNLTPAQMAGLRKHPDYSPIGRSRPGIHYEQVGTLHGDVRAHDARAVRLLLMTVVKLRSDGMSIGVGIPTRIAIVSR